MEALRLQRFADEALQETTPQKTAAEESQDPTQSIAAALTENAEIPNSHPALSLPKANPEAAAAWGNYQPIMDALKDTLKD